LKDTIQASSIAAFAGNFDVPLGVVVSPTVRHLPVLYLPPGVIALTTM
jgi:hypothetical protein